MPLTLSQDSMTFSFIAQSLGVTLQGKDGSVTSVVSDSRKILNGCLFVALKGERVDGHDYIENAISQGASAILCDENFKPKTDYPEVKFFKVKDSLDGYRKLAHAWRCLFDIPVIAVAGSVGKTTTKELLASILRGKFTDVLRTQGSQNGFVGIPMTLLELRKHHEAAVIEVGIDDIGAMAPHMELVKPTHALLTAIGPEHLEKLKDIETVAKEEAKALLMTTEKGGSVILNLDDPYIAKLKDSISEDQWVGSSITTGPSKNILKGTYSIAENTLILKGYNLSETKSYNLSVPLLGTHNAKNLLLAYTTARMLGLSHKEITDGLETFKPAFGRSEIKSYGKHTIICDYYNANPESVTASLEIVETLKTFQKNQSTLIALGDMLELGKDEEALHRNLAKSIVARKISMVLLYGQRMQWLFNELHKMKFQGLCKHFSTHEEMALDILEELKEPSIVLIKGSRSMKMEKVYEYLLQRSST